jgi:hypothetical protein
MGDGDGAALRVAKEYFEAWTSGDFDSAAGHIDDAIVCDAPAGRIEGATAFRQFMEPFTRIVTYSQLVAAYGDDEQALVLYDTDTVPVKNAPGAEYTKVGGGKVIYMRIIFDRLPFEQARQAQGQ